MSLSLRPYQVECLEHTKTKNTIVSLPTGKGKTLIAARLIEHYLKRWPDKRVAFLVPTRPLVEQQSGYCVKHCLMENGQHATVQKLFGDEQAGWQQKEWNEALERNQIFLGTPAIFLRALVTEKYVRVDHFSLFVFDECHNATGNHPMAAILRDAIAPHYVATASSTPDVPRILGLTASIIIGKTENMEQKRQKLEALMNSTVVCPNVAAGVVECIEDKRFHRIEYMPQPSHDRLKETIEMHIRDSLDNTRLMKDVKKAVKHCSHVFSELGMSSMNYYVEQVIVSQIRTHAENLELQDDENCNRAARGLRACLPALQRDLKHLSYVISSAVPKTVEMSQTPKLKRLLELLGTNFANQDDDGYRGIVFVEQVALVSALAKQIEDELRLQCGAVAGTKAQAESARQEQLDAFRDGHVQVLVATAALEEGIDVAECRFVVRYSDILTTKGHIQGAGRARHSSAEIYYFENCPENEKRKEAAMVEVARDQSLALSDVKLRNANAGMHTSIDGVHPYPFNGSHVQGEVNVFNCKQLLVSYCSRVLGKSISPENELYDYFNDTPGDPREKLSSIRYPTPDGWEKKLSSDYMSFWGGVDLSKELFHSDRVKTKSQPEREEMCFVYLVVVELREKGLLDKHNKPIDVDAFAISRKCPLRSEQPPRGLKLKETVFQPKLDIVHDSISSEEEDHESRADNPNQESRSAYPFTCDNGGGVTFDSSKRVLNEYLQVTFPNEISSKNLYEYRQMGRRKSVATLKFPSPNGWLYVRRSDYDKLCSELDLENTTIPGKTLVSKEEAVFAFLAVVRLRQLGHLNASNKASVDLQQMQENCMEETNSEARNENTNSTPDSTSASVSDEHAIALAGCAPEAANNETLQQLDASGGGTFADADEDFPITALQGMATTDNEAASTSRQRPPVTEVVAGRHSPETSELGASRMY